ncbi:hypothetical protein Tco_0659928 [Tanacetum coccineum]
MMLDDQLLKRFSVPWQEIRRIALDDDDDDVLNVLSLDSRSKQGCAGSRSAGCSAARLLASRPAGHPAARLDGSAVLGILFLS